MAFKKLDKDIHLSNKNNAEKAQTVYDQLEEDYPKDAIQWVKSAKWEGPVIVPLSSIDYSNKDAWEASDDPDHVEHFVDEIVNEGYTKPIILVNEPNKKKLIVVDGHHRSLAYRKVKKDPMAYVAEVGGLEGGWSSMHSEQQEGKYGSNQK